MTLIAAVHAGDRMFLAADSGTTDESGNPAGLALKLDHRHGLAWGFSGHDQPGVVFQDWMRSEISRLRTLPWLTLERELVATLTAINEPRLAELRQQGVTHPDQMNFVHGIVAGYACGEGRAIARTFGHPTRTLAQNDPECLALGEEAVAAAAFNTMTYFKNWKPDRESLEHLMNVAVINKPGHVGTLSGPIRMIEIRDGTSTDVSGPEFRLQFPSIR